MRDKTLIAFLVLAVFVTGYALTNSPDARQAVGAAATAMVRPVLLPLVELINLPTFVYCAALTILVAGVVACLIYRVRSVGPRLAEFRAVRGFVAELPEPRMNGGVPQKDWPQARQKLGAVLMRNHGFISPWTNFQAEAIRSQGVPNRPFSSFASAAPEVRGSGEELMQSLPGYFTSVGLIFTFVGLVVALYFAAKGFRTGNLVEARAAIIQLLNAASFKFLTSVAALISALIVSLYGRYTSTLIRHKRSETLERIDVFVARWRESVGTGRADQWSAPPELLRRFDELLARVASLSTDLKHVTARDEPSPSDALQSTTEPTFAKTDNVTGG